MKTKIIAMLSIVFLFLIQLLNAQQVIKKNGKYGLIDAYGKIVLMPTYDSIISPKSWQADVFIIINDGKFGYAIEDSYNADFIISDVDYDEIKNNFELQKIIVKKGDKYGFVSYAIKEVQHHITGAYAYFAISYIFVSDVIYDQVSPLKKDGKFGKHVYLNIIIPPIYDTVPVLIYSPTYYFYERGDSIHRNNTFFLVKKDSLYGVLKGHSKLVVPIIYKKGELNYIWEGNFVITQNGKPIKIFNLLDSTHLTLYSKGKPVIATDSFLEKNEIRRGQVLQYNPDTIINFYKLEDISYIENDFRKGTAEQMLQSLFPKYIIFFDNIIGSSFLEYNNPNSWYSIWRGIFIKEFTPHEKNQEKIRVKIYNLYDTDKTVICEYVIKIKDEEIKFAGFYEIGRGNNTVYKLLIADFDNTFKWPWEYKGYIDGYNREFHRFIGPWRNDDNRIRYRPFYSKE